MTIEDNIHISSSIEEYEELWEEYHVEHLLWIIIAVFAAIQPLVYAGDKLKWEHFMHEFLYIYGPNKVLVTSALYTSLNL